MHKRLMVWVCMLSVLIFGVSARLWSLSQGGLQTVSVLQSTRRDVIASVRATIYDRYRQPLVNRSKAYTAFVSPWNSCVEAVRQTADLETFQRVLTNMENGERSLVSLQEPLPDLPGIVQVCVPVRYDKSALACHVIGYVDEEGHGVCGVERQFDEILHACGTRSEVVYRVDALGRVAMESTPSLVSEADEPLGGVVLTLDTQIQEIAQQAAAAYLKRGAVLITRAEDAQVLASVSVPTYDPNRVEAVLGSSSSPLLDRTQINYNCGSVFKILTAAAALEHGISVEKRYVCAGTCSFDGVTIGCHKTDGHGEIDMSTAMAQSCNTYFMQLAQDLGADALYRAAQRAGFDRGLTIMEDGLTARALLPNLRDLSAAAALANLAIGQGELMATPYHVAALMGAVVNDGVWSSPSLYLGVVNQDGEWTATATHARSVRVFSSETAACLRAMLEQTVTAGTGTEAMPSVGGAGGKTGTAETGWIDNGEEVVQSWFTGYYPAEHPQYVITVLSENGEAEGRTASPLFKAVCDELERCGLVEKRA